jgi:WD40 repeat protein
MAGTSPTAILGNIATTLVPPMTATEIPSVANRTRPITAGAPVVGACFVGAKAVFVLGEEALLFVAGNGDPQRLDVHAAGILAAVSDGERIVTGGDDGKVVATAADMTTTAIATDSKHRWVDHVAVAPDGTVAWSAGKETFVQSRKGEPRMMVAPSTVGGLAFAPKGLRLAIAHYNGVTLWFPNAAQATPERLEWKGSHLDVTFSPDGRYLVTAMQEPALHGWRLVDGKSMRMSGYSAKVRAMAWSAGGRWLATSGAPGLIMWPFHGKDGPMGKEPLMVAPRENRVVSSVACHPRDDVIASGYENGAVLLVRMVDGAEILARHPDGSPVSALAWNAAGTRLAFSTEEGDAGIVDLA